MPPSTTVLDRTRRRVSAMFSAPPRTPPGHLSRLAADSLETGRTARAGAPRRGRSPAVLL
ncbi:hypothetical protein GCM10010340_09190 [Streptomyces griseoloalbus]|nr:hypothetical protein GCM10010340_09190 [Streptomyces albaduncus]